MRNTFRSFWKDVLWYLLGFIPVILTALFFAAAVTFWEEYALKSTAIFALFSLGVYFYLGWKRS
ncbi:putative membrane protein [Erwinia toletana]|uniref:Membrane protein n=1 Tax=Winslowiella toletana TaxID=92490 RepID=A0ABS4P8M3_9GAMM|nr:putative membrane protein [Winslowiella toletana]